MSAPLLARKSKSLAVVGRHVGLAPVRCTRPLDRQDDTRASADGGFCERKGLAKDASLLLMVVRWTNRVAQGQVGERESGDSDLVDDVACGAEDQRRDSCGLEVSCGQTDRLVTDRSKRNQHREIDLIFAKRVEHLSGSGDCAALAVPRGDSSETRRDRTDDTVVGKVA